jgi:hypothetical protein
MLQLGTKITQLGDPMRNITLEQLHTMVSRPKPASADFIQQLRVLAAMDERQYRELKKQLPYFVCGIFQPPVRRKEHFATIAYFMLDLDHLAAAGMAVEALCGRLREDRRVAMYFLSPGGDGLKVMFKLAEPCRDAAMFSSFYKIFARHFGEQYGLLGVIDIQTHDVTRACFLSADRDAYFQPAAEEVRMDDFLKNLDYEEAEADIRQAEKVLKAQAPARETGKESTLDTAVMDRIRERLNPTARPPKMKDVHVPPALDEAMPLLRERLSEMELELRTAEPIQYGRKIQVFAGRQFAEINVFHGKRGFTIVKTTKTGSHAELADLVVLAIRDMLEIS